MSQQDAAFQGSIPTLYENLLVPMYFAPFARDLAGRVAALEPDRILELAAGTGAATRALVKTIPAAAIVASDLNQAMIDVARETMPEADVTWQQADALDLPFGDMSFDSVVCQFGVMFFPDKKKGFSEALRVLAPKGHFIFNVWDSVRENDFARVVLEAMAEIWPFDPPAFLARTPHGYHDVKQITHDLTDAGFTNISFDVVEARSVSPSALHVARGLCEGSPMRAEIEARNEPSLAEATQHAATVLQNRFGKGEIAGNMRAIIVTAQRP